MFTFYISTCKIMDVCCCPRRHMAMHQVSTKHDVLHVFVLYGYMYVAPQDESCRYRYGLCEELLSFSLRAIWYMCTLLYVYCKSQQTWGKYHISVKHTTVSILSCCFFCVRLQCCFSVLVHVRPTLPCLRLFCVSLYQIWGVISPVGSHKYFAANLNVPSW